MAQNLISAPGELAEKLHLAGSMVMPTKFQNSDFRFRISMVDLPLFVLMEKKFQYKNKKLSGGSTFFLEKNFCRFSFFLV